MPHSTIGYALYALGYRQTIWVNRENIARRDIGTFDPDSPWGGPGAGHWKRHWEMRYGAGSWDRKGDLVGERLARDIVETVARHPSNPLDLQNNTGYVVSEQDLTDVKMVKSRTGNTPVYDSLFVAQARELMPEMGVPQTPPPPTPAPPVKPSKPTVPVVPPTLPPTPSTPIPPAHGEYLSYWLALPTQEAVGIVTRNLQAVRMLGKGRTLAQAADVVLRHGTEAWRKVKADLS